MAILCHVRRLLYGAMAFLCVACVPLKYEYFEPSAPSGQVGPWRGACGGADDHITFESPAYSWVEVRLSVSEFKNGVRSATPVVELTVQKNIPIEFGPFADEEKQRLYAEWGVQRVTIELQRPEIEVTWENDGHAVLELSQSIYVLERGWVRERMELPSFEGDWLEVVMPALSVDGQAFEIPRIRFDRVEKFKQTPINC